MESNEFQDIWKSMDPAINLKTKEVLNQILTDRIRETIDKFTLITGIAIIVCIGFITFLTITVLNRLNDPLYMANNLTLIIISVFSLYSGLHSWNTLRNNRFDQPLKQWLEYRIDLITKELTGKLSKLHLYLLPIFYLLTVLSIHVYYSGKSFSTILHDPVSLVALSMGTPIGLGVAFFSIRIIRKFQFKSLNTLKDLYQCL